MDLDLSEEHQLFRETIKKFVEAEIKPIAKDIDEQKAFPSELFKRMGQMGYYGLRYPEEVGGSGGDFVMFCILCEELAKGSMSVAAIAAMQSLMGTDFVFRYGTDDHKNRLLKPAILGKRIGTICMTEANAGSDLGAINTTATKDREGYILRGTKMWVTSGTVADFFTVAAKTKPDAGIEGIDFFIIEKDTPGLVIGKKIDKLGVRASETTELALDDCRIPKENRLGEAGRGFRNLTKILCEIRVMTGALSIGLAQAALDAALQYANQRTAFGKPIGKFQAIKFKFADMVTELEAAKLLVYKAAWEIDQKKITSRLAAIVKLYASEVANRVADEASRVFASYGFSMEYDIQRHFRDARFLLIGGGTSEILKTIIAKEMGL